jgi:iron(III) transport system permease protein
MNWVLLKNSLLVASGATAGALVMGFVAALALHALPSGARKGAIVLAVAALAMPPFLVTNCWLDLLGANGILHSWLPLNIFSFSGAIWILTLLTWPIALLFIVAAWRKLEPGQLEADPALNGTKLIRWLLWPLGRSSAVIAAAIIFVLVLNNFAVPAILQVRVLPAEAWVSFNANLNALSALKLSWPLIVAPALLLLFLPRREVEWPRDSGPALTKAFRRQLGKPWFSGASLVLLGALSLSVVVPLLQLVHAARTWNEFLPAAAAGLNALANSFGYATATGLLAVVVGMFTWRWRAFNVMWLAFFVPGVLLGIGLIVALNRPGIDWFYRSAAVVVMAFVIHYFALALTGTAAAMRTLDRDLTDYARLSGARNWTLFRHVHWPQIAPQISATAYVVYLLCLWDVETLIVIVPPGGETLALRIFNLLHYGHNSQVNALCMLLLFLAIAPLALWELFRWLVRDRRRFADE